MVALVVAGSRDLEVVGTVAGVSVLWSCIQIINEVIFEGGWWPEQLVAMQLVKLMTAVFSSWTMLVSTSTSAHRPSVVVLDVEMVWASKSISACIPCMSAVKDLYTDYRSSFEASWMSIASFIRESFVSWGTSASASL